MASASVCGVFCVKEPHPTVRTPVGHGNHSRIGWKCVGRGGATFRASPLSWSLTQLPRDSASWAGRSSGHLAAETSSNECFLRHGRITIFPQPKMHCRGEGESTSQAMSCHYPRHGRSQRQREGDAPPGAIPAYLTVVSVAYWVVP